MPIMEKICSSTVSTLVFKVCIIVKSSLVSSVILKFNLCYGPKKELIFPRQLNVVPDMGSLEKWAEGLYTVEDLDP